MQIQPFVVTPKDYARSLDVVGEKITVLASKTATQGYEIFRQEGDEPSGSERPTADVRHGLPLRHGVASVSKRRLRRTAEAASEEACRLPRLSPAEDFLESCVLAST